MPNYARVTIVGHIGKEPELRVTQKGEPILKFSVAVNDRFHKDEPATWWNCSLFGKRADALKPMLHGGDPVMVEGEPKLRKYDGGQSLDVRVTEVVLIRERGERAKSDDTSNLMPPMTGGADDGSIPF